MDNGLEMACKWQFWSGHFVGYDKFQGTNRVVCCGNCSKKSIELILLGKD